MLATCPWECRLRGFRATAVGLIAFVIALAPPARAHDYVVIVHRDNPARSLRAEQVARIFKAELREWSPCEEITFVLPRVGSAERSLLLERVYGTDELGLKQHWASSIARGRIAEQPRAMASPQIAMELVARTRGAVAVIRAEDFDPRTGVKALAIDGSWPGERDYWLRDAECTTRATADRDRRTDSCAAQARPRCLRRFEVDLHACIPMFGERRTVAASSRTAL
jgi:hypothetical protein